MNLRVQRIMIAPYIQPCVAYKAFHNIIQQSVVLAHSYIPSTNMSNVCHMSESVLFNRDLAGQVVDIVLALLELTNPVRQI